MCLLFHKLKINIDKKDDYEKNNKRFKFER